MTRQITAAAVFAVMSLAFAACEAQKSSNPTSPTVAGPIAGVSISVPQLLEPTKDFKYKESQQPIKLVVGNATSTGVRTVTYMFEVASDANFSAKVFARSGVPSGDGGKTSVQIDRLESGRTYFWRAKADDGANSSDFASSQFDLLPKPVLNPPAPVSPINNQRVTTRRPTFTIVDADRNSGVGSVSYEFQVALDQAFTKLITAGVVQETPGQTSFVSSVDTAYDIQHFWRVRATDGDTTSAWTVAQTFLAMVSPGPSPSPSPSPSPAPGGSCTGSNPQKIVECERAKYGHMDSDQLLQFEKAVARSLNASGIAGGPFGILRKAGGSSCGGYSCDIICSGSGTSQKQWDILGDAEGAQTAAWNGPSTYPGIRVDVCEVQ